MADASSANNSVSHPPPHDAGDDCVDDEPGVTSSVTTMSSTRSRNDDGK